ncbi:MAG: DUF2891 family protein, partial [Flavobacteriales bacterium]
RLFVLFASVVGTVPNGNAQHEIAQLRQSPLVLPDADGKYQLTAQGASYFARLSLMCTENEARFSPQLPYSNAFTGAARRKHWPAFFGCYDWHSAVHNHWCLIKLLKQFPEIPENAEIRLRLNESFRADVIQQELRYFQADGHRYFEFPYGQSWLLKLACELKTWDDPEAKQWLQHLEPLCAFIAENHIEYWESHPWAKLSGSHDSPAMGLSFAYDYAVCFGKGKMKKTIAKAAKRYYLDLTNVALQNEPVGYDFMSAGLLVGDLMHKVLKQDQFEKWMVGFVPGLFKAREIPVYLNIKRLEKHDGFESHWDGYHLNRIWCLNGILQSLSNTTLNPDLRGMWIDKMNEMWDYAQTSIGVDNYDVDHWLSTFSVYALLGHTYESKQ